VVVVVAVVVVVGIATDGKDDGRRPGAAQLSPSVTDGDVARTSGIGRCDDPRTA